MIRKTVFAICALTVSTLALAQPRLNKNQGAVDTTGEDKQANIGSSVTDPAQTKAPNAERVPPQANTPPSLETPHEPTNEEIEKSVSTLNR